MIPSNWLKCLILLLALWPSGFIIGVWAQAAEESSLRLGIQISIQFLPHQEKLLKTDLDFLKTISSWNALSQLEKKTMDLLTGDSSELNQWLRERIQFLLPIAPQLRIQIFGNEGPFFYPYEDVFPQEMEDVFTMENSQAGHLMSNSGVAYYLFGKRRNEILSLNLKNHFPKLKSDLPVLSPRIGIIHVHKNTFNYQNKISVSGREPADRLQRLSFLFHEGRHSDGHGANLGFYHTMCPPGHDYTGRIACDTPSNGAYSVSALFIKKSLEVCHACTEGHKETLRLTYLDSKLRVLDKKNLSPEEQEQINQYENDLNFLGHQLFDAYSRGDEARIELLKESLQEITEKINQIKKPINLPKTYWKSEPEVLNYNHEPESD